jgi:hypothetical protein
MSKRLTTALTTTPAEILPRMHAPVSAPFEILRELERPKPRVTA